MARKKRYNPEAHDYKGRSYKKGGKRIIDLREKTRKDALAELFDPRRRFGRS